MAGRIEPATAMRRRARPLPRRLCIEATIELAVAVAGARELFKSNGAFGEWWDGQDFELNHQERAALVQMGREPERLRDVLGATTRTSIRLIYDEEFRFTNAGKTESSGKPKLDRPKREKPEPQVVETVAPEAPALDATRPQWPAVENRPRSQIQNTGRRWFAHPAQRSCRRGLGLGGAPRAVGRSPAIFHGCLLAARPRSAGGDQATASVVLPMSEFWSFTNVVAAESIGNRALSAGSGPPSD